jgi:hypothetical protein
MKDYKARGSNLQFRERKRAPRGTIAIIIGAAALAAVVYFGGRWFFTNQTPADEAGRPAAAEGARVAVGNAIPLTLPAPPASYNVGAPDSGTPAPMDAGN